MNTVAKRLESLEQRLGQLRRAESRDAFEATPERRAFLLLTEAERRLVLDLFESREDIREDRAVTLQSASPEEAAAYTRYRKFVRILEEKDRAGREFLAAAASQRRIDPTRSTREIRDAGRYCRDLTTLERHLLDQEEPPDYLKDRLARRGFIVQGAAV